MDTTNIEDLQNTNKLRTYAIDLLIVIISGLIVSVAFYVFQNSNEFSPGGVGGLATITYYLLDYKVNWSILMVAFNLPIFVLLAVFVNKRVAFFLSLYIIVQSFATDLWALIGIKPYCLANNQEDFEIIFACIATGVISGFGFSMMLKHFGASGGTYAISALIKRFKPATNIAYTSFIMDSAVVVIAFFVYGMKITPVICTLLNLLIANVVVDFSISGLRTGYKFEIVTDDPIALSQELIEQLKHGVTEVHVEGMYTHSEKHLIICIIRKKQIGTMMKIIKKYPHTFASFSKVNEVFGRFAK